MKKLSTLLASLVLPGVGHILRGRITVGVAFFAGVIVLLNLLAYVVFRPAPDGPEQQAAVLVCGLSALWLGCQAHLAYLLYGVNPAKYARQKEDIFHEGLRHYVRDELADAIRRFEDVLRFESFDYDAYFYLGLCHRSAGRHKSAVRCFKKCVEFDDDQKWAAEVAQELAKARAARKAKAKPE